MPSSSSSSANPRLHLSFPANHRLPAHQMALRLTNLSPDTAVAYKIRTLLSDLDLFLVSPNPGRVPPSADTMLVVTCKSPEALGPRRAKFVVASVNLPPHLLVDLYSQADLHLPFAQAFGCRVAADRSLAPAGCRAAVMRARGDSLLRRACSTPVKAAPFAAPAVGDRGDEAPSASAVLDVSAVSTVASFGPNATALDRGPLPLADPQIMPERGGDADSFSGARQCAKALCLGLSAASALCLSAALFAWRLPLAAAAADFVRVLLADPDEVVEDGDFIGPAPRVYPRREPEAPRSFLSLVSSPLMLWTYTAGHLLWLLSSAVLFFGLTCGNNGRNGRRLVYPWLLMMVFSHLTTASTLFELCCLGLSSFVGGGGGDASDDLWYHFATSAATLTFGCGAVYLLWAEVRNWKGGRNIDNDDSQ